MVDLNTFIVGFVTGGLLLMVVGLVVALVMVFRVNQFSKDIQRDLMETIQGTQTVLGEVDTEQWTSIEKIKEDLCTIQTKLSNLSQDYHDLSDSFEVFQSSLDSRMDKGFSQIYQRIDTKISESIKK